MLKSGETSKEDTSVRILQEAYPQRVSLTPVEVAWTLFGSTSRSDVQKVRGMLLRRHLMPNLSKIGGRWVIPLVGLGRVLDELQQVPIARPPVWIWPRAYPPMPAERRRRWRAPIGDRVGGR